MQLVPKETNIVFMANLSRIRNTAIGARSSISATGRTGPRRISRTSSALRARSGQADRLGLRRLPAEGEPAKEFAAILRGTFDEAKLVECAQSRPRRTAQTSSSASTAARSCTPAPSRARRSPPSSTARPPSRRQGMGQEGHRPRRQQAGSGTSAKDNEPSWPSSSGPKHRMGCGAQASCRSPPGTVQERSELGSAASMKNVFGNVDSRRIRGRRQRGHWAGSDAKELARRSRRSSSSCGRTRR